MGNSKDVRRGIVNEKANEQGYTFFIFEIVLLSVLFTWYAVSHLHWNGFIVFVVCSIGLIILSFTKLYSILSILLSIAWGVVCCYVAWWLSRFFGGGLAVSIAIAAIACLLGGSLSYGAREMGREYLNDVGEEKGGNSHAR